MSEYKVVKTQMTDVAVCVQALENTMPEWKGKIEYDPAGNIHLKNMQGVDLAKLAEKNKAHKPPCTIRIPRSVNKSYLDIGFSMNPDGTLAMHLDEDSRAYGEKSKFQKGLKQNYGQIQGLKQVVQAGGKVTANQWFEGSINTEKGPIKGTMIPYEIEIEVDEEEGPEKAFA